jgi:hypothetical protein
LKGATKVKKGLFIVMAGLMVLSILVAPVAAGTIRTEYQGFESYVEPLSPGRQWISEEGVLHIRGGQEAYLDEVDDPRLCGDTVVTLNVNFHFADPPVFVYGPMWGTFLIENDDGYWEGSWVGERTEQGFSLIRGVLRGHEAYEGLQARVNYVRESPDPTAAFAVHGVIMAPGGH